jgi:hypothetical protein
MPAGENSADDSAICNPYIASMHGIYQRGIINLHASKSRYIAWEDTDVIVFKKSGNHA